MSLVEQAKKLLEDEVFDFEILGFISSSGKIYKLKNRHKGIVCSL